jgi:hypothetical protein
MHTSHTSPVRRTGEHGVKCGLDGICLRAKGYETTSHRLHGRHHDPTSLYQRTGTMTGTVEDEPELTNDGDWTALKDQTETAPRWNASQLVAYEADLGLGDIERAHFVWARSPGQELGRRSGKVWVVHVESVSIVTIPLVRTDTLRPSASSATPTHAESLSDTPLKSVGWPSSSRDRSATRSCKSAGTPNARGRCVGVSPGPNTNSLIMFTISTRSSTST